MKFNHFITDIIDSLSDYGFTVFYDVHFIERYHRLGNVPLLAESLQELYNADCYQKSCMTISESVSLAKSLIKWYNL